MREEKEAGIERGSAPDHPAHSPNGGQKGDRSFATACQTRGRPFPRPGVAQLLQFVFREPTPPTPTPTLRQQPPLLLSSPLLYPAWAWAYVKGSLYAKSLSSNGLRRGPLGRGVVGRHAERRGPKAPPAPRSPDLHPVAEEVEREDEDHVPAPDDQGDLDPGRHGYSSPPSSSLS